MTAVHQGQDQTVGPTPRVGRSTSPALWLASAAALLVLLVHRSQQLHAAVTGKVAETGAAKDLTDPAMTELAVNISFYLGVVLSTVFAAVYFSLVSVAESTFFPGLRRGGQRLRIGILGAVATVSLLSVHLLSLALSVPSPKDHWVTFLYVAALGLGIPWIFRRQWEGAARTTVAAIFTASLATAAVSLAL
ncbi:hypothetical protein [Pseudarthrobacter cellobiosi]|uniref:hypothetical protein n=1 Tax=Pseudarthrobacter cellobiosi TaxID=2953654 RepID=UPI00208FABFA|nr:hypothetical protein [Pseudarthrobacter sp. HLT1-5]MCO4254637.1 hypothetical protein [Pseudarthrobacter sp. HLT1-5]